MTLALVTNPAVISLDGVELGGIDADGVQIVWVEISGWHDAAPKRSSFTDRDNADGQFDGPVYKSGRVVTVTGWAVGPSRALTAAKIHRIKGMLGGGRRGTFTVNDPDFGILSVQARISDGPQVKWNESKVRFDWQFQVTAVDPLLYGPVLSSTTGLPAPGGGMAFPLFDVTGLMEFGAPGPDGKVTLTNSGTADTWPEFVINGNLTGGFFLTEVATGRQIQYTDDVPDGSVLTIRTATGRADINGSDRSGSLVVAQWWPVPANGSSTVQLTAPAAAGQSGTLTARVRPAYE